MCRNKDPQNLYSAVRSRPAPPTQTKGKPSKFSSLGVALGTSRSLPSFPISSPTSPGSNRASARPPSGKLQEMRFPHCGKGRRGCRGTGRGDRQHLIAWLKTLEAGKRTRELREAAIRSEE